MMDRFSTGGSRRRSRWTMVALAAVLATGTAACNNFPTDPTEQEPTDSPEETGKPQN
jgi:hypothetical protein